MKEINSYEEYDKEYKKRQQKVEKLIKRVETEKQKLSEWCVDMVTSLSHKVL